MTERQSKDWDKISVVFFTFIINRRFKLTWVLAGRFAALMWTKGHWQIIILLYMDRLSLYVHFCKRLLRMLCNLVFSNPLQRKMDNSVNNISPKRGLPFLKNDGLSYTVCPQRKIRSCGFLCEDLSWVLPTSVCHSRILQRPKLCLWAL